MGELLWNFSAKAESNYLSDTYWRREERQLRINERLRKSVAFIGILDDTGAFAPYGTAFFVRVPLGHGDYQITFLVTAKHVVDDINRTKRPAVCRLNKKNGKSEIGHIAPEWFTHHKNTKCDVAVSGVAISLDTFDVMNIRLPSGELTQKYISENDVGCGDEVLTIGLLVHHFGKTRNTPVVRVGNISAMPEEKVDLGDKLGEQEVYLIESRSIGGLSGSPVFYHTPLWRVIKGQIKDMGGHQREYLMGVNLGLFETSAHGDKLPIETQDRREHFLEAMSAGIAVVAPIKQVMEIIEEHPGVLELKRKAIESLKKKPGFVPSSVAKDDDPPATDENPNAQEDFKSLLNAAARKPKQGG